ncbi:type II secretion system protein [Sphingobacterium phlebotomi]|uniref:Type II secretion system protein n=1 Tax=Sphingobacterium phlebotomi TaxID=2605433 RepID=A0A5D4H7P3_9SPHI|nr:type II secretion system protein [Sphingobacterium phlebotomi]TYR36312.1 type II secretion system protein [Sphingobacterium phlebotomi]
MTIRIRYSAFTLLEMTIAMLIAAICMGIAFYVLRTFTQMGEAQQREKQAAFGLQLFQHRMQREFLEADYVRFADNTLVLDRDIGQTRYVFLDSTVIRSQQDIPTDTLYGQPEYLTVEYIKNLRQEIVEVCQFELQTENKRYPFVLRKVYSAENLINLPAE